jgi:hypothetical protein
MTETKMRTVLYEDGEWIYGINTKNQFVVLKDFVQVSDIVTNINSDYAFCMDGSTLYLCTKCDGIRQILRFTLSSVPEPLFTDHNIPFLTYMIYFNGYICATTESDIYIYHVASNHPVLQPTWTGGTYQGIAGFQNTLYLKKNNTVLEIPFQNGLLNYSQATLSTQGPFALYFQVEDSVRYNNVLITLPFKQSSIQVGFDKVFIKEPTPYISLTDNPTIYRVENPFAYVVPYSYEDKVICGTICFLSGSMVLTDQGSIAIEYLIPNVHTIFKKKIIGVSMTYSLEPTLVCIPKHAFSKHMPIRDTFLSNNHKIYYDGSFLEAEKMIGYKGVHTIPYENQILYNVILKEYGIMNVNNLICETLDPCNPVAKEFIL